MISRKSWFNSVRRAKDRSFCSIVLAKSSSAFLTCFELRPADVKLMITTITEAIMMIHGAYSLNAPIGLTLDKSAATLAVCRPVPVGECHPRREPASKNGRPPAFPPVGVSTFYAVHGRRSTGRRVEAGKPGCLSSVVVDDSRETFLEIIFPANDSGRDAHAPEWNR